MQHENVLSCRIWGSHNGGYEESNLVAYNAMFSAESQPTFRKNMSPPSTGSACYLLHASFLLDLLFGHKNWGNMFLRNVGRLSRRYILEDRTLVYYLVQTSLPLNPTQWIPSSPRACAIFLNVSLFYRKLKDHPFSTIADLLNLSRTIQRGRMYEVQEIKSLNSDSDMVVCVWFSASPCGWYSKELYRRNWMQGARTRICRYTVKLFNDPF
jgi:hypothetical protein